jgi:hypothetical protein
MFGAKTYDIILICFNIDTTRATLIQRGSFGLKGKVADFHLPWDLSTCSREGTTVTEKWKLEPPLKIQHLLDEQTSG